MKKHFLHSALTSISAAVSLLALLHVPSSVSAQVPNYVPTNGLVGWWPFTGNANDLSGNGNNGTVNGATLTTDRFGNTDKAYEFNNSYIEVQPVSALNGAINFTWGAWIKLDNAAVNGQNYVLCRGWDYSNGFDLWVNHTSFTQIINGFYTFQKTSSQQTIVGGWHHILVSKNASTLSYYFDGELDTTHTYSAALASNNELLYFGVHKWIGQQPGYFPYYFKGKIDDVAIWNRALTTCEILYLYNAQLNSASGISGGNNQSICPGNTVTLAANGGTNYAWNNSISNGVPFVPTTSMEYVVTGTVPNGCIGSDTVSITVLQPSTSTQGFTTCSSYTWNGNTYTQSGQYQFQTINAVGCDSTATLNLTINQPSSSSQTQTALDSYTWPVNGQTYMQSGTYTHIIPNAVGCDSTITLNLTLSFTGIKDLKVNAAKKLVKITDLNGRETPFKKNILLLFIYEDGTVERVYELE